MSTAKSLAFLASSGQYLFSDKYAYIWNVKQEIQFIIEHVPFKQHLTELEEIDLWDLFSEAIEQETTKKIESPDERVMNFKEQLSFALTDYHHHIERNVEFLGPATIVRKAIFDIFPTRLIEPQDEAFVGLIARYSNMSLWARFLAKKHIEPTPELLHYMGILRDGMEMVHDRVVVVQTNNMKDAANILWMKAKAESQSMCQSVQ